MNVAERRRGDFFDWSNIRTRTQSRAELGSSGSRTPCKAPAGIPSHATDAHTCAHELLPLQPTRLRQPLVNWQKASTECRLQRSLNHFPLAAFQIVQIPLTTDVTVAPIAIPYLCSLTTTPPDLPRSRWIRRCLSRDLWQSTPAATTNQSNDKDHRLTYGQQRKVFS